MLYAISDGDDWTIEVVEESDYTGQNSHLYLDADDVPHITHYVAMVKQLMYVHKQDGIWMSEMMNRLDRYGTPETSLQVLPVGTMYLLYSDQYFQGAVEQKTMYHAIRPPVKN